LLNHVEDDARLAVPAERRDRLPALRIEGEEKRSGGRVDHAVAVADAAVAEDVAGLRAAANLLGDVVGPQQVAARAVERVHAAARVGHVHHAVHDHRRGLVADAVDHPVLKQPPRHQRPHIGGGDLIQRREARPGEIEVVQRPVRVLSVRARRTAEPRTQNRRTQNHRTQNQNRRTQNQNPEPRTPNPEPHPRAIIIRPMRWIAVFLFSLLVQAGPPSYPPPYPREGTASLIDNERVLVWDVTWPKGAPPLMHRHPYDMTGIYYWPGDRTITSLDGTKRTSRTEAGRIQWLRAGGIHAAGGARDASQR